MNTSGASAPSAVLRGRERACAQCNAVYRSPRATSRYCTPKCRKRAHRGTEDTDGKTLDLLSRWLLRRTYAGQIGPTNRRDPRAPVYALTVPRAFALGEWNGWNPGAAMTEEAFASALDRLDVHGPDYTPPHKRS
jgi:hypothetical protein